MKQKIDEIRYKLVSINKDITEIQQNDQICRNTYNTITNPSIDIQTTKPNKTNKNLITNPNRLKFTKYAKINPQLFSSYYFHPFETPRFKTITDLDLFFNSENKFPALTKRDYIKNSNLTESISNITQSNSSQKIKTNQNKLYIPVKMNNNSNEFLKIIIEKNKSKKRRIKNLCSNK